MTLRLPSPSDNKHATIVSAYASTMTNPDEVKDKFYNDLDDVISAVQQQEKQFNNYHLAKPQVQMQFLPKFTRLGGYPWQRN